MRRVRIAAVWLAGVTPAVVLSQVPGDEPAIVNAVWQSPKVPSAQPPEIEAAAEDRREAVEFPPGLHATLLDGFGRHAARRERRHSVAIVRMQPPPVVE